MAIRRPSGLLHQDITEAIIAAFFEVYSTLGYGFLEQVYAAALEFELVRRGHHVAREVRVCVSYKGHQIAWQRIDMVVDDLVVVELKALSEFPMGARRQAQSYVNATQFEVGLVLNFGLDPKFERVYASNHGRRTDPHKS